LLHQKYHQTPPWLHQLLTFGSQKSDDAHVALTYANNIFGAAGPLLSHIIGCFARRFCPSFLFRHFLNLKDMKTILTPLILFLAIAPL